MKIRIVAALAVALFASPLAAELRQSAPDGALIEHHFRMNVTPGRAWDALLQPALWWPSDHTWSADSANLSLQAEAGGCFCERWNEGSAEHAHVILVQPGKLLRMRGSLGPLQEMSVSGVLTITLKQAAGGTDAVVTYRISGDASHELDAFMPVVDKVIGQQFGAWVDFTG